MTPSILRSPYKLPRIISLMKSISVSKFRVRCLAILNEVAETGEPVLLTKHGLPTAMIVPPPRKKPKWTLGQFRHTATIHGDLIAPLHESWEVHR